jgi:hypothetical protein
MDTQGMVPVSVPAGGQVLVQASDLVSDTHLTPDMVGVTLDTALQDLTMATMLESIERVLTEPLQEDPTTFQEVQDTPQERVVLRAKREPQEIAQHILLITAEVQTPQKEW